MLCGRDGHGHKRPSQHGHSNKYRYIAIHLDVIFIFTYFKISKNESNNKQIIHNAFNHVSCYGTLCSRMDGALVLLSMDYG
jgi:hypothetical protein